MLSWANDNVPSSQKMKLNDSQMIEMFFASSQLANAESNYKEKMKISLKEIVGLLAKGQSLSLDQKQY